MVHSRTISGSAIAGKGFGSPTTFRHSRTTSVSVFAGKGFGSPTTSSKTKSKTSNPLEGGRGALRQNLADKQNAVLSKKSASKLAGTFDEGSSPWVDVGVSTGAFDAKGKNTIAKVLPSKEVVVLYRAPGGASSYFCSDANSTAFKYPMIDAKVEVDKDTGDVTAEVPFDGTVYVLNSKPTPGAVKTWCPQNTAARRLLGTMKSKEDPVPLRMYPVRVVEGGRIEVKFSG